MGSQVSQDAAVAAQPHSSCVSSPEESHEYCFRLFDLPRELRDNVYENALVDHATFKLVPPKRDPQPEESNQQDTPAAGQPPGEAPERPEVKPPGLLASVRSRPVTNVLLCNKTLRHEYEERSKQAITLVLKDNENYSFQAVILPEKAKEVYWAELHIILFCHNCPVMSHCDERTCQAAREIVHHKIWIATLLSSQLPKLRALEIHAYLCYDNYRSSQNKEKKVPCESIIQRKIQDLYDLPKLKNLTLYNYEFSANPELDGPKVVMLEWPARPKPPKQKGEPAKVESQECNAEQVEQAGAETSA